MFRRLSPAYILILGFLAIILLGGLALCLPFASSKGEWTSPVDAFFTATSATCVTGLVTLPSGSHWSAFGKGVILMLIQTGGLGFMSMAMLFSVILRRKVSPKERIVFSQSMNLPGNNDLADFLKSMVKYTFIFEGAGAILLSIRFVPLMGAKGIAQGIFTSVSAFCNAGFDILPDAFAGDAGSLSYFAGDSFVNIAVMLLIVFGGLGFFVWRELFALIFKKERLSLYSKLVLYISGGLIVFGTLLFLAEEWNNPETLGGMDVGKKLLCAVFQSVTFRTAGFQTFALDGMTEASKAFSMLLMFIGGSSGSTAGGVKTVTMGVLVIAVFQMLRGRKNFVLGRRSVDKNLIYRALALVNLSAMTVIVASFIVSADPASISFGTAAFECFSAFGTVGLTLGITPALSAATKIFIMALMFFGRVGIVTVTYGIMMAMNRDELCVTYPRTNIIIG